MNESSLKEKDWNGHFVFFHLKEFQNKKEVYLNGKPLKWYNRFKNGDIVEVIEKPGITALATSIALAVTAVTGLSVNVGIVSGLLVAGVLGVVAAATSAILGGVANSGQGTTRNREYSSTTQPELKGANNEISNDIVPVAFGVSQQTPSYAQTPFRLVADGASTNKYHQYFIANYNDVIYSDFKLGETSVNNYSAQYLDIQTKYGQSEYIGFDNVKALSIDEELSYNSKEEVQLSSTVSYNQSVSATSVVVSYQIKFENVDLSHFATKTFQIVLNALDSNGNTVIYSDSKTVNSDSLDLHRVYTGSSTFSHTVSYINFVQILPTLETRGNTREVTNQLETTLIQESVTAGSYTQTKTLNDSLNYYTGTVSEVVNTSPETTTEIDVIISFPNGLYTLNQNTGSRSQRTVNVDIHYKAEDGAWKQISTADSLYIRDLNGDKQPLSSSTTTVNGSTVTMKSPTNLNVADQLFFRPIGFSVPKGKYSVRVRSADFKEKSNYSVGYPNVSEIQFRCDGDVIDSDILPKTNQIRFIATAYKGLSGTLQKFNYIATARIPIWNGTDWNTIDNTTNPAAIVRYLLTDSKVNPRAESLDHIDNDSLVEYYEWCEEAGYKASGVIAEAVKIGEIINEILKNSQCAMIPLYNGKHTFVMDKPAKIPVGMFNQHNSWDFKWIPNVGRQTEAIRASFVENDDWTEDELTLYWYDGEVHDEPEPDKSDSDYLLVKKEYKYVNDRESVKKIVEYELKTIQTKRNQFEFTVNLEAMNMLLMDRIYISNTANMQGEQTGLIKNPIIDNGMLQGFELYSDVEIPNNAKIIIRSLDYENEKPIINVYDIINSGNTYKVYIEPIAYTGIIRGAGNIKGISDVWHYDGDLFTLGQDTIYDCIVTDIKYNDDGTATITAREY
ncbi:MAG: hypothetical protein II306_06550 [Clostridia bacterium]|nr:hypothetical protein [Clostridia bacterium]